MSGSIYLMYFATKAAVMSLYGVSESERVGGIRQTPRKRGDLRSRLCASPTQLELSQYRDMDYELGKQKEQNKSSGILKTF